LSRSDVLKLIRIFRRRRWLLAAVSLVTFTVVLLVALLRPQYYRASAVVMPSEAALRNPLSTSPTAFADGQRVDRGQQEVGLAVFMGLVKSPEVLRRTAENLGLKTSPARMMKLVNAEQAFGAAFSITALAPREEQAIKVANGLALTLKEYYEEARRAQAADQRKRLEERIGKIKAAMGSAQGDISTLRGEEVDLPTAEEQGNRLLSRIAALQADLDVARAQASDLQERLRRTQQELASQPDTTVSVTSTTETPLTNSLRAEIGRLEQDLVAARSRYTDKHREVQRLREQIEDVKARLASAMLEMDTNKTISPNPLRASLEVDLVRLKIDDAAIKARVAALQGAIAESERKARSSGGKSVTMAARIADFQAAQEAYREASGLLQAVLLEQQSEGSKAQIQIVQKADFAEGPMPLKGPTRAELLLLGLFLSVIFGIGATIGAESLDAGLKTTEDVQQVLQLPLSGTIPEVLGVERRALPRITSALPISPYAECYRFLRTSILCNGHRHSVKSLMFTAASPAQGNSTTIANLALSLAEAGRTVVLVDCDLRRPMQHVIFGVSNEAGLTNVLSGEMGIETALKPTDVESLFLLPAGPQADNPSALVNSERMKETLQGLKERFEYVLVDTPPVLAFSDSAILSSLLDGVILVVRVGDASRGNELQAKNALEKAGATILGVVVNGLSPDQIDSFHFHARYYQHAALPGRSQPSSDEDSQPIP